LKPYDYKEIKEMYGKISPFEFKDILLKIAKYTSSEFNRPLLDAGRGNPNWTCSTAREAFFTFGNFSVKESRDNWDLGNLSGMPQKKGIADRFYNYINENLDMPGAYLAREIIDFGINEYGFDRDEFVHELSDGIIGDNYPLPDRMLPHIEKIVHDYLVKEMKYDIDGECGDVEIFAVEGATAAMCYVFDSLMANELLQKGDRIALMTPIFTPYLEIPTLPRYNFDIVHIYADVEDTSGNNTWQYSRKSLAKLEDPSIKAVFIVNPGNPTSVALDDRSIGNLMDIVQNYHQDLMIISDDVYGTFVNNFRSLMSKLPFNTLGVYSYSKYFGVTGWRLGTFALHQKNVFDKRIQELPEELKRTVNRRYREMSMNPSNLSFMSRVVADSRMVALNHTAGLSTPQQVQMAFFSAFALIDKVDSYKKLCMSICHRRIKLLFEALEMPLQLAENNASYYTQLDIEKWARLSYGDEFFEFIEKKYSLVDILFKLADDYSVVLLSGDGFAGPKWSLRVSLANLDDDAYIGIGTAIKNILSGYLAEWESINASRQ
jgi:aspartate 4-decarboxylase